MMRNPPPDRPKPPPPPAPPRPRDDLEERVEALGRRIVALESEMMAFSKSVVAASALVDRIDAVLIRLRGTQADGLAPMLRENDVVTPPRPMTYFERPEDRGATR